MILLRHHSQKVAITKKGWGESEGYYLSMFARVQTPAISAVPSLFDSPRCFAAVDPQYAPLRPHILPTAQSFSPRFLECWSAWHSAIAGLPDRNFELSLLGDFEKRYANLPEGERMFHRMHSQKQLELLLLYGQEALDHLRGVGGEILAHGSAIERGRFVHPERGVPLVGGGRASIRSDFLDNLAFHLHGVRAEVETWSRTLCDRRLWQAETSSDISLHPDQPSRKWDAPRRRVYGMALALASGFMPEENYQIMRAAAPALGNLEGKPLLLPFHQAFSAEFQKWWAEWQFAHAWQWRKFYEPGGTSHPHFRNLSERKEAEQLFIPVFANGVLHILRSYGPEALRELRVLGRLIERARTTRNLEDALNLEKGELVDPVKGLPLRNGKYLLLKQGLLDALAWHNHHLWMLTREWTWSFERDDLRQLPRHAHKLWFSGTSDVQLNNDRRSVYGLAYAIGSMPSDRFEILVRGATPFYKPQKVSEIQLNLGFWASGWREDPHPLTDDGNLRAPIF